MDKVKINNQVILMRKHVKQAKVYVINKLVKEIKLLQNRKGNEAQVQKAKRKADRYLEEVILLKKMKPDYVSRLALCKAEDWKDVLAQKTSTLEDRSLAILANYGAVQKEVEKFHSCNQNLVTEIPYLVKEWEEKSKLPKPPGFKRKKFDRKKDNNNSVKKDNINSENIEEIEESLSIGDKSSGMAKRKIIPKKRKIENKSKCSEIQNKHTPLKSSKKVENRLLKDSSDENIENSDEDSEVIVNKYDEMAEKKMIPNERKIENKTRSFEKQNKHFHLKNSKTVESKLLVDASSDENVDESDDEAIEDKLGYTAKMKMILNKNKQRSAKTQNKLTAIKNTEKISDSFFLRPDEFVSITENKHFDQPRQKKSTYMHKPENEHKINRFERRNGRPKRGFQKSEDNSRLQKRESSNFDQERGFRKKRYSPKNQEWFQNREKKEFHSGDQKGFNKGEQNNFLDFRKQSFTEKANKKPFIKDNDSSFRNNKIVDKKGDNRSDTPLHPSWEAKRKQKELTQASFQGKRMVFDD